MIAKTPAGFAFTFLGRAHAMSGDVVDWSAPSLAPRDQLWRMHLHYMEYLEEVDDADCLRLIEDWIAANPPIRTGAWRDGRNSLCAFAARRRLDAAARVPPPRCSPRFACAYCRQPRRTGRVSRRQSRNRSRRQPSREEHQGADLGIGLFRGREGGGLAGARASLASSGARRASARRRRSLRTLALLSCSGLRRPPRMPLGAARRTAAGRARRRAAGAWRTRPPISPIPTACAAQFNDAGLRWPTRRANVSTPTRRFSASVPPKDAASPSLPPAISAAATDKDYLVIDCGRIGPDALPAHAHGDILSFEWSVAGERIIVDPGVYEYFGGARRAASRTALSHNTLCFEGADQAEFFGAFRCGQRPDVQLLAFESDGERLRLEGAHDGFGRLGATSGASTLKAES